MGNGRKIRACGAPRSSAPRASPEPRAVIRVLVAEDHTLVREGICRLLADDPSMAVVHEVGSCEEVLPAVHRAPVDVAIINVSASDGSCIEAIRGLAAADVPALAMSPGENRVFARRALAAGARGYVAKTCDAEELRRAVRAAARGERHLPASIRREVGEPARSPLSERELETVRMLAEGLTVRVIARRMGVRETTVRTYRRRILDKLDVDSAAEMVRWAILEGIV